MKKIIYTMPDGRLAIVTPVINTVGEAPDMTEAKALQRALDRLPADAANVKVVEESALPADRTFRDAWVQNPADSHMPKIDMPKAREVHRNRIRVLRAPLLASLDTEYMRADEAGDTTKKEQIAAQKQVLRDMTDSAAIDQAATPEALKVLPLPE